MGFISCATARYLPAEGKKKKKRHDNFKNIILAYS